MDHRSVPKANVDRCHTSDAFDGPIQRSQSALYTRLLGSLLLQRFKSYDRSTVKIHVEQNGEVSVAQVNELVVGLCGDLERRNERRPIVLPECALQTKQEEPAFSSASGRAALDISSHVWREGRRRRAGLPALRAPSGQISTRRKCGFRGDVLASSSG